MGTRCTVLRPGIVDYQDAWQMQRRAADELRGGGDATLFLLEHPPTYTLGARGNDANLLLNRDAFAARGAALEHTDRGGDVTFHGPGQLVGYPIIDIRALGMGAATYVRALQDVLIDALREFGIAAHCSDGRIGVWCENAKIAAIGVRVSRGVTTHGFALNVNTDLTWFDHIVPCGIRDAGVTSMQQLRGAPCDMRAVEDATVRAFERRFGMHVEEPMLAGARDGR